MTGAANFEFLLRTSIGLDPGSIGAASIDRAVRERQAACGLADRHEYWRLVNANTAEHQALIEAVVVSETWFFRDREAFTALARLAHEQWLRADPGRTLRLLSLPCATGEEPYSMAMAMLDAGVPADWFCIDAIDVSVLALAKAAHAVYGRNSFRGRDLEFRDCHFESAPAGHRPSHAVRRQVRFRRGNLLDADFLPGDEMYDVIFCRNVLIYFDRVMQDRAIGVLARLLMPHGTLFVAPSETGVLLERPFVSAKIPMAFAFRKGAVPSDPERPAHSRQVGGAPTPHQGRRLRQRRAVADARATAAPARSIPTPRSSAETPADPQAGLAAASRLADQGCFAEAIARCEDELRRRGPSAAAFQLLGLIHDATGDVKQASTCYRKALYLEPQHLQTLIHLALLCERHGDLPAAQVLRRRAARIEKEGGSSNGGS